MIKYKCKVKNCEQKIGCGVCIVIWSKRILVSGDVTHCDAVRHRMKGKDYKNCDKCKDKFRCFTL